jgi:flagellar biosynthetic protein FlhB
MAEDSDLERSEPASQRRLDQAREEGQVPRSPELATFSVLLAGGAGLAMLGDSLVTSLKRLMAQGLTLDRSASFRPEAMAERLGVAGLDVLLSFVPYLILLVIVALAAPLLVSGWIFTFGAVAPQWQRLSLFGGLKRMFSVRSVVELGKAIVKTLIVGGVAAIVLANEIEPILGLAAEPPAAALSHMGQLLVITFLAVVGAMALIVAVDIPFQIWEFRKQYRMTKEEVRQEYKETEGDPQIKARIRQLQREQARRRMMSEVPKADVVVTNPTHFAVALRYREGAMRAPMVVAKGGAQVAERIIAVATENRVPVLRAAPLARALHAHADLGREIPSALFGAVAEVLAYVYQLTRYESLGGEPPAPPSDIRVPPELDPAIDEEET